MLSYTALLGMHVLRVQRDDEWCALMLRVTHDIYKRFVFDPEAFVKQDVLFGTRALLGSINLRADVIGAECDFDPPARCCR